MIRILPPRYWNQLEGIFNEEFDSALPEENSDAEIFISTDGNQRTGFILAETVKMIGQIYIYPEFREKGVRDAGEMVRFMQHRYKDVPVACVASEPRFEKLYRRLGMEKIEGTYFRKN